MGDNIPWTEKYRPQKLDDIIAHDTVKEMLKKCIKNRYLPHLMFYGPPGTGKTSTITAYAREMYGDMYDIMVLEINAAEERGIEMVRMKIKPFVSTRANFFGSNVALFKLVILDEADYMTADAQAMLRLVIEEYTKNARFCIICNYNRNINLAIISRCMLFKFPALTQDVIKARLEKISKSVGITMTKSGIITLIKLSAGDMRKLLNMFQTLCATGGTVDEKLICKCLGFPSGRVINDIFNLLEEKEMKFCDKYDKISRIIEEGSYHISDVLKEITVVLLDRFKNKEIGEGRLIFLLTHLAKIEMNTIFTSNVNNQLAAMIGIFTRVE